MILGLVYTGRDSCDETAVGSIAEDAKNLAAWVAHVFEKDVVTFGPGLAHGSVLFHPGSSQVNPAALPTVARIADVLRGIPNQISLGGHADVVPIHNRRFRNNWELAAARSLELLDLLTTRYKIAESRFSISSFSISSCGSTDPRNSNDTAEGRADNRRVEILILDE
jgi:flagellar motor protein MotB